MRLKPVDLIFVAALAMGVLFFIEYAGAPLPDGQLPVIHKGATVGLMAIWALFRAPRTLAGRLIVVVLMLGALGDILLETHGLTIGALAFLAGHLVATGLYLGNRQGPLLAAVLIAGGVAMTSWLAPFDRSAAPGLALYGAGLGLMAGTAIMSRFPRHLVGLGAALFVLSDLLIFSKMGPLMGSPLPGMLIWPTYVGGQALIAWGVVTTLVREHEG